MMFSRVSQRRGSRRSTLACPTVEGCEPRQLMSGLQTTVDLTTLRKHAPDAVPALVGEMVTGTTKLGSSSSDAVAAELAGTMRKH
jgi:hypothetical protein